MQLTVTIALCCVARLTCPPGGRVLAQAVRAARGLLVDSAVVPGFAAVHHHVPDGARLPPPQSAQVVLAHLPPVPRLA